MKFIERCVLIEMILKFQCQSNTASYKFNAPCLVHIIIYTAFHIKGGEREREKKKTCFRQADEVNFVLPTHPVPAGNFKRFLIV